MVVMANTTGRKIIKNEVTIQLVLPIMAEASYVRFEGRHKPIPGGLTVAVQATDTLKPNI